MRIVLRPGAVNVFGPVFKRIREQSRQKLTQDDVAARITALGLPMDRSTVSRIENGKRGVSDIELLYFIMALRASMARVFALANQLTSASRSYAELTDEDDELVVRVAEADDEAP